MESGVSPNVTAGEVLFSLVAFTPALRGADGRRRLPAQQVREGRNPRARARRDALRRRSGAGVGRRSDHGPQYPLVPADRRPLHRLLRPRGLRLRCRHPPPLPRQDRRGASADHQHDRARLGRQRGLDPDRRRGDLRRLPALVRHPVQRLLPRAPPDAGRPHRPRGGLRVPQQGQASGLAGAVGLGDLLRQRDPRPPLGRGPRQPSEGHADRRRQELHRRLLRPSERRTRCSRGSPP